MMCFTLLFLPESPFVEASVCLSLSGLVFLSSLSVSSLSLFLLPLFLPSSRDKVLLCCPAWLQWCDHTLLQP